MTFAENLLELLRLPDRPSLSDVLDRKASNLFIGVELEFLIVRDNKPARSADYYEINRRLKSAFPESKSKIVDGVTILQLEKSSNLTFEFKPDFAFNVFEISIGKGTFPEISEALRTLLPQFKKTLKDAGLTIHRAAAKKAKLEDIELAPWSHLENYLNQFPNVERDTGSPWYPAEIAATQIHLDVLTSDYFEFAVYLYIQEFIFARNFSFGVSFDVSNPTSPIRADQYEDGLGKEYLLKTIPHKIYQNREEYRQQLEKCPRLFSCENGTRLAKDLAYIRPRSYGSIEFRSACANADIEIIEQLMMARIAQFLVAVRLAKSPLNKHPDLHYFPRIFWEFAQGRRDLSQTESNILADVEREFYEVLNHTKTELSYKDSRRKMSRIAA